MIHIRRETQIMEKHTLGKTQIFTSDADYEGEARFPIIDWRGTHFKN